MFVQVFAHWSYGLLFNPCSTIHEVGTSFEKEKLHQRNYNNVTAKTISKQLEEKTWLRIQHKITKLSLQSIFPRWMPSLIRNWLEELPIVGESTWGTTSSQLNSHQLALSLLNGFWETSNTAIGLEKSRWKVIFNLAIQESVCIVSRNNLCVKKLAVNQFLLLNAIAHRQEINQFEQT